MRTTSREVLRLSALLASIPTAPFREHRVMEEIRRVLTASGVPHASDRWGNLIARYRPSRPAGRKVALVAHTDHPGLIVTECTGFRASARWLGGVAPRYFPGARVRVETATGPIRGRILRADLNPAGRVTQVLLDMAGPVPIGAIGGWDVVPFAITGNRIRTKSADDLLGCACILSLLKELAARRSRAEVWGVFTRAEEVGLFGATAVAEDAGLPSGTAVLSIETSRELPCGRLGRGPIIRVGDRASVFDPEISQMLRESADAFARQVKGFRWQRGLMDGGTCEASAFQAYGYRVGAFALPLGNYHNMGSRAIAPEIVHRDDLVDLARFLPFAVEWIARARSPLETTRKRFGKGFAHARKEMLGSRSLLLALAAIAGMAGAAAQAPAARSQPGGILAAEPPPIMKPPIAFPTAEPLPPGQEDPLDDYDALSYAISIRISPPPQGDSTLAGVVRMEASVLSDLSTIDLQLGATLSPDSAWNGSTSCPVRRVDPDRVRITLPAPVSAGSRVDVGLRYSGYPGPTCFPSRLSFYMMHGQQPSAFPVASTLSEPNCAHQWWPCKDRMDDKALVDLTVDAPAGYVIAGNGILVREESAGGRSIAEWRSSYPVAPYLVAFAASNYLNWTETYHAADGDSLPLVFYAYPEDADSARAHYRVMREALEAFEPDSVYGPYPFRNRSIGVEKLGVVEFPCRCAMENQTIVSEGATSVASPAVSASVLAHEISHHWFGDAVTCANIDHIWLNEGFASYSEALFAAASESHDPARAYRDWMMRLRNPIGATEYPGSCVRPEQTFGATVYRKGAWVLHMLRGVLGRETFFRSLHDYYRRHQYGNATTEDFTRSVEETSGRDLSWFFIPWLYGSGRPQIAWDWQETAVASQARGIRLHLHQTQPPIEYPSGAPIAGPPEAYAFPLEVRIYGERDSLSRSVFIGGRDAVVGIDSIPFRPTRVALDPDNWLLADPRVQRGASGYLAEIGPPTPVLTAGQTRIRPNPSRNGFEVFIRTESNARTDVAVFDLSGRRIRSLPSIAAAGDHAIRWDGKDDAGRAVASGLYMVRVAEPGDTRAVRAVLIK